MSVMQDIIDLYSKGGIEITTFAAAQDASAGQLPLIRTVIQPNASLITWVHSGEESEKAIERHHDTLQSHLQAIKNLRQRLKTGAWVAAVAAVLFFNAYNFDLDLGWGWQVIRLLLSAGAVVLLRYLFRYLILFVFRWYFRRKIQQYFSSLTG